MINEYWINDVKKLLNRIASCKRIDKNTLECTTEFLNRINDNIVFYIIKNNETYKITDNCETIESKEEFDVILKNRRITYHLVETTGILISFESIFENNIEVFSYINSFESTAFTSKVFRFCQVITHINHIIEYHTDY